MNEKSKLYIIAVISLIIALTSAGLLLNVGKTEKNIGVTSSNILSANANFAGPVQTGENSCSDSDNNNPFVKGTTRYTVNGKVSYYNDTCIQMGPKPNSGVLEYYCSGNTPASRTQQCNCVNGACIGCGDGIIEPGEGCDGPTVDYMTCSDLGFVSGKSLVCTKTCQIDTTVCSTIVSKAVVGPDGWTNWLNRDTPEGPNGDYELLQDFTGVCDNPIDIKCALNNDSNGDYTLAKQNVTCDKNIGLVCQNSLNHNKCKDYKVKFRCPIGFNAANMTQIYLKIKNMQPDITNGSVIFYNVTISGVPNIVYKTTQGRFISKGDSLNITVNGKKHIVTLYNVDSMIGSWGIIFDNRGPYYYDSIFRVPNP